MDFSKNFFSLFSCVLQKIFVTCENCKNQQTNVVFFSMAAPKGHPRYGGRTKGTENKATKDVREAYRCIVEGNIDRVNQWLDKVAKTNPAKAIELLNDMSEYIIPKLARTEITGKDGSAIQTVINLYPPVDAND